MASTTGRRVVEYLTNKSGGAVAAGDVVVIDTANNEAFTTTTSAGFTGTVGVAQEAIANDAAGRILTAGYAALVNVNASVTRGHFGKTHTVAKQATDNGASRSSGSFCQFLTGGATPTAHLFGIVDSGLGASLTDHTHAASGTGADGGGATLAPTSLSTGGLVVLGGRIDSTINADTNDYNPSGMHQAATIRFTSLTAQRNLTGIHAGTEGEILFLQNNTSFSLVLPNESGSSSAANRFRTANAASVTIRQQGTLMLIYLAGRWCTVVA